MQTVYLTKDLVIQVKYEWTPAQVSHNYYDEDEEEEFTITSIKMVKGNIVDLVGWGDMNKIEAVALEQIKEERALTEAYA